MRDQEVKHLREVKGTLEKIIGDQQKMLDLLLKQVQQLQAQIAHLQASAPVPQVVIQQGPLQPSVCPFIGGPYQVTCQQSVPSVQTSGYIAPASPGSHTAADLIRS